MNKERLTGAIILVVLIVLLVPELLQGPVKSGTRPLAATPAEGPPLVAYNFNLDGGEAQGTKPAPGDAQAAAAPPPQPQPVPAATPPPAQDAQPSATETPPETPATSPAPTPAPAPRAKPAAAHPAPAPGEGSGGFMVQLGTFASHDNAEHLAQKVKAQGFSAGVSQYPGGKHLYRVRVGPVHDRAAAAQLQAKLKAAGHTGAVVPR